MKLALMLFFAALPVTAFAQGDPFAPPPREEREGRHDRDRAPQYIAAGDFVLVPQGAEMLLVDTKTGCVWVRRPGDTYNAAYWNFEFPSGAGDQCRQRLAKLRTDAINGTGQ